MKTCRNPYQILICFHAAILFCTTSAFSQNDKIVLNGTLTMTTGEVFPYKLSIRDSFCTAKGYAYTYEAPNETKATIRGTIDKERKVLTFRETGIVSSHDVHTKAFMCLINAQLQYTRTENGKKALTGNITTEEADNTACTGGTIVFGNEDEIRELFSNHEHMDTVIEMRTGAKKQAGMAVVPQAAAEPLVEEKVTAGIEKTYEWHTDSLVMEIWDGGTIDGDLVTIGYNGVKYLEKYFLIKQKKRLVFPVSANKTDVLVIVADNEGTEPPNTASVRLCDGDKCYSLLSYNKTGQKSVIKIKRVTE